MHNKDNDKFTHQKSGLTADSVALVPKCRTDNSVPVPNCPDTSDLLDCAEVAWVRTASGPKCLRTGNPTSRH